jgi:hypothetical protein
MLTSEDLQYRLERFERTVATCLAVVPALFSLPCLLVAVVVPTFEAMFKDFGAPLPGPTQFVLGTRVLWAIAGIAVPVATVWVARKRPAVSSVVFSTVAAVVMFFVALFVTSALFLPIAQLGELAGGVK